MARIPYQRSMGSTDVEYGIPRKPANKPKKKRDFKVNWKLGRSWLYFFAVVAIIAGSLVIGLKISGNTIIRDVVVNGHNLADAEVVLSTANIPIGIAADSLKMIEIIDRVEALPYVQSARIQVSPTGRMQINLTERIPLAILMQGDAMALVDKFGVKMPVPANMLPDVPLVYGFNINPMNQVISSESFRQVADFIATASKNRVVNLSLSEIGWHPEEGVIALTREHGVRLVFGKDSFENKLKNWQEFYRTVIPAKGMSTFTSLDFRFKNQIVAVES
jgi:hypothetical protein